MNDDTLLSIHCYDGDAFRVEMLLPSHEAHKMPVVILSPEDRPVRRLGPHICRSAGASGYIGQHTLDRQLAQLRILLEYPFNWFLLHDSDSVCLSTHLPVKLYENPNVVWSGEVSEPRPHSSPYPKIAMQPPYFLSRAALEKIIGIGPKILAHPITPYIDWAMLAWTCEAGLLHQPFTLLERPSYELFAGGDSWKMLEFRIQHTGAVMMHPIKTAEHYDICIRARRNYESSQS